MGPQTAEADRPYRPRGRYSRLICLGCRDRRIRCDLPDSVEIPDLHAGELRKVQTPCYRCRRLGLPCVVRQTILGRPGPDKRGRAIVPVPRPRGDPSDIVSRIVVELPPRKAVSTQQHLDTARNAERECDGSVIARNQVRSSKYSSPNQGYPVHWNTDSDTLLIHIPQSAETILIIRAIDQLRHEKADGEWFRHLPAHVGHTHALDLSIKSLVTACAYARGVPRLSSRDCYQALALALNAVQADIERSRGELSDDILASTALLAPFEGVVKKNGIPTSLHVEGLAAILAARPASYPVTQLARDIIDFHACESAIMACIQGTPSPFEAIPRDYFANDGTWCCDSDRAQLKALGSELFVRIPRLAGLLRSLHHCPFPQKTLLFEALELSQALHQLQDPQAERRLLQDIEVHSSCESDTSSPFYQSLRFTCVPDFEALSYYWQNRLSLLRLDQRLHELCLSSGIQANTTYGPEVLCQPGLGETADEMCRLAKNIVMCAEYAKKLPMRKHHRLFAHALVMVWGATMYVPMVFGEFQDGEGEREVGGLLLRIVNDTLEVKPELTVEDMDTAADIFVGGPPKGRFVERVFLLNP